MEENIQSDAINQEKKAEPTIVQSLPNKAIVRQKPVAKNPTIKTVAVSDNVTTDSKTKTEVSINEELEKVATLEEKVTKKLDKKNSKKLKKMSKKIKEQEKKAKEKQKEKEKKAKKKKKEKAKKEKVKKKLKEKKAKKKAADKKKKSKKNSKRK